MATEQEFDYSVNLLSALLWRFNNAPNLTAIVQQKQNWYAENHEGFWYNWFLNVFYLATCNAFGIAVWSIILNLPVNILGSVTAGPIPFGFGMFNNNFGNSNFSPTVANAVFLTLSDARFLLRLRYYQLTSRGVTIQDNAFLSYLFGPGNCYIIDNLNMTITCHVRSSVISANLLAAIQSSDVMPRPAAVSISYVTF